MKRENLEDNFKMIGDDTERSIAVYNDDLMVVKVKFLRQTTIPDIHSHEHQQATYVTSGNFVFWIEGEAIHVNQGDVLLMNSNQKHGCICTSDGGELLDVFTPMREDFVNFLD